MRILLVDDQAELTDPVSLSLQRQGYTVDVAHDGQAGHTLALQNPYDLLILDWMLPGMAGIDLCESVRSHGITTPVLFLTAKDTVDDRVLGLDAGADDYLVKPFELKELLARVRALLRRPPVLTPSPTVPPTASLKRHDLALDEANQLAYRGDRRIELSDKECQLLAYLMRHPNQVLTHDELHQALWDEDAKPSSNALVAQVRLLRRKIEADGEMALIQTVYGKGYRFGLS